MMNEEKLPNIVLQLASYPVYFVLCNSADQSRSGVGAQHLN